MPPLSWASTRSRCGSQSSNRSRCVGKARVVRARRLAVQRRLGQHMQANLIRRVTATINKPHMPILRVLFAKGGQQSVSCPSRETCGVSRYTRYLTHLHIDIPTCRLRTGTASVVLRLRRSHFDARLWPRPAAQGKTVNLAINRVSDISDNVGGVKHFLSARLHALREERHFALVEWCCLFQL